MIARAGAIALLAASATFAVLGGCTKSPPAGNAIAEVARGDSHLASDRIGASLARIHTANEGTDFFLPHGLTMDAAPRPSIFLYGHVPGVCPDGMANVEGRFCIDRWEASLVELLPNGDERPYDPYTPVEHHVVRAVTAGGVVPHGYISEVQAKDACARSGKRLCKPTEWRQACMGPKHTTFGYGNVRQRGACNDDGVSPMISVMRLRYDRPHEWTTDRMNDPRLNQAPRTLSTTGAHASCTNGYGVYDMVGNLHEWVDDPDGTFQGGYYLDTHINGDGCTYRTVAHGPWYHDYSTGFRCCADVEE
ncbi:MAG TPA: SUMF1/EgtB/PvdO family nonheme iron enzyme [Polyangiaceae bacterium]